MYGIKLEKRTGRLLSPMKCRWNVSAIGVGDNGMEVVARIAIGVNRVVY
jgi:hypothetical protein